MSRTIEIKDLPDDLVERLEEYAADYDVTLHQLLRRKLEEFAPAGRLTVDELIARRGRVRVAPSRQDILDAIDAGREERGAQLEAAYLRNRGEAVEQW